MIKSIFKEIIIILLLFIIIILLLGIIFYDYIPENKTVPAKVQEYALDEIVKTELKTELDNSKPQEVVKTYQLDSSDIKYFEETNQYHKGKVDPFEIYNDDLSGINVNVNNTTGGTFLNIVGK